MSNELLKEPLIKPFKPEPINSEIEDVVEGIHMKDQEAKEVEASTLIVLKILMTITLNRKNNQT